MVAGTVYGVALNDKIELQVLGASLEDAPYNQPPDAPVLYIKPRNCLTKNGGRFKVESTVENLIVAPTIALAFDGSPNVPSGVALALDLFDDHGSFYRPAIRQQCRDGSLPLGEFCRWEDSLLKETFKLQIDEDNPFGFDLSNLVRTPKELVDSISGFMTLADGDVLLIGHAIKLPVAPNVPSISLYSADLPSLSVDLDWEVRQ